MPYFYQISGGSYEESVIRVFVSEEKLTKEQLFDKLVVITNEYLITKTSEPSPTIDVMSLLYCIPDTYFIKYNLSPLQLEETVDLWGWNSIGAVLESDKEKMEHYWESESSDLDRKFIDAIKENALVIIKQYKEE